MIVKTSKQTRTNIIAKCLALSLLLSVASLGQNSTFHNAPASAKTERNPYQGQQSAAGKAAFQLRCVACHGPKRRRLGKHTFVSR